MLVAKYDQDKYPFRLIVRRYFDGFPLEQLHKRQLYTPHELVISDQSTTLHKQVYKSLDKEFYTTYYDFVKSISPHFAPNEWCVQKTPTFRFHTPGQTATKEFHRDRDYGHAPQTVNIVIPLTKMFGTAAVHVEAAPYARVMERMEMQEGEMCVFDGANSLHGTHINNEDFTRVSFDFRMLPLKYMPPEGTTTVTQRIPIALGSYYLKVSDL